MTIVTAIPGVPVLPATATADLVFCIGIEFYQEMNGNFYQLAPKNGMQLEKVF